MPRRVAFLPSGLQASAAGGRKARILIMAVHTLLLPGCMGFGYAHYFEASSKGARITGSFSSAYIHLLPGETYMPVSAEFRGEGLAIACHNREFDLMSVGFYTGPLRWPFVPIPDPSLLWPNYDPDEIEVIIDFEDAHSVEMDLRQVKLLLPNRPLEPSSAKYFRMGEDEPLLAAGVVVLRDPLFLELGFDVKAGRVDSFVLKLPTLRIDGRAVALPPVTCTKRGSFAFWGD